MTGLFNLNGKNFTLIQPCSPYQARPPRTATFCGVRYIRIKDKADNLASQLLAEIREGKGT
ncbi:MAG: hypothetical protein ACI8O8_002770, partial [Oleiphilaceae bacterium]